MAVGGLHQSESEHGRYVTAMGVEMVQNAKKVTIPRKKENIQVRILSSGVMLSHGWVWAHPKTRLGILLIYCK